MSGEVLNVLSNLEGVIEALKAMGDYDDFPGRQETFYSLGYAVRELLAARETSQTSIEKFEAESAWFWEIYGSGGFRRYFLRANGVIEFSCPHSDERNGQRAADLGFRLLNS